MKAISFQRFTILLLAVCFLLLAVPAISEASPNAASTIHVVQKGETLAKIAANYGVTLEQLMQWNNIRNANRIYSGQRLVIRNTSGGTAATANSGIHVVRRGETLSKIAKNYGTTVVSIKKNNKLRNNTIFVGQRLRVPKVGSAAPTPQTSIHVVRDGETLAAIAKTYGTTAPKLAQMNGLKNMSFIKVGQRLKVPGSKGNTGANAAPAASGPKKVLVDISQQRCYQYQGETLLNEWKCSTGQSGYGTKTGTFQVQSKLRKAFGSAWNIWMPYWLGIYWAGPTENGFHGLPWNANTGRKIWAGLVGTPATFGCVMLNDKPMKELWEWADIGTQIVIQR